MFLSRIEADCRVCSGSSPDSVVNNQKDHGTNHSDQQAIQVQACDSGGAEGIKEPASNDGADNPQNDIEDQALALFIDNLAPDETGEQTKHNPRKK
jgi:hypothetical protein